MDAERWKQIDALLDAVFQLEPDKREAFLDNVCAGDESLRKELITFIAADDRARSFLKGSALEQPKPSFPVLAAGTLLSNRYEIVAPIGAGGMGEVFHARDRRLSRNVAIKVLPESVHLNPQLLARFEREAKALAALSHPNILSIHDFATDQGISYAVMELLKGETLRTRMHGSLLSGKEALGIAIAIAEGLSAAHTAGIVHRDLKPENIFLTSDDRVKILDFGLARLESKVADQEARSAPTATHHTEPGVVMGTVPYMSPEQVRGDPVDTRTDIFSFGSILYEMISGHRAFLRETSAETMTAILKEDPPSLPQDVTPELQRIISHCMEKKPENRFQSARDLTFALKSITVDSKSITTRLAQKPRVFFSRILAVAFTIVILVAGVWILRERFQPAKSRSKSIAVLPFANLSDNREDEYFSDGVTEDVIAQLAKIADLKVISRTSVMPYKNTKKGLRQIAKELDVEVILEGSVRRSQGRIRIVGQLIDASTDEHIWADTFDRELKDIFEVQSDVAQQIATALKARLSDAEKRQIEKKPTRNLAAYDYYLKGRESSNRLAKESNDNAIVLFKKAVDLDPNFALAYASLADAYSQKVFYGTPESIWDTSIEIGKKAISLDPTLAEGYQALGYVYQFKGWLHQALEMQQKAVELNPNYARAAGLLGRVLWTVGRLDESLHWVKKYHQLDPTSAVSYRYVADVYTMLENFPEAKRWYEQCLAVDPEYLECIANSMNPYLFEGNKQAVEAIEQKLLSVAPNFIGVLETIRQVELFVGNYEKALEYSKKLQKAQEDWLVAEDGYIFMKNGNQAEANKIFSAALKYAEGRIADKSEIWADFMTIGEIHAVQGNKPEAYKWLQRAIDAGFIQYRVLLISPLWESLRGDQQFQQMLTHLKARVEEMRKRAEQK